MSATWTLVFCTDHHKTLQRQQYCIHFSQSDCMNHEILLAKLLFCGVQGVYEDWFRSYLTNRRQKV